MFALQYALAELWKSWGIVPAAVVGHGVGQYAAACAAGVFSLEDGLKLVAARARLVESLPADGRMLAVMAGPARVAEADCTLRRPTWPWRPSTARGRRSSPAGPRRSSGWRPNSHARRIRTRLLPIAHAFPLARCRRDCRRVRSVCETVEFRKPRVPIIAISGKPVGDEIAAADYWRREPCEPVRFADGIAALDEQGHEIFLEIGPRPKLLGLGRRCMRHWAGLWLPSLKPGQSDWPVLLSSLAKLYAHGVKIDWTGLRRGAPR